MDGWMDGAAHMQTQMKKKMERTLGRGVRGQSVGQAAPLLGAWRTDVKLVRLTNDKPTTVRLGN